MVGKPPLWPSSHLLAQGFLTGLLPELTTPRLLCFRAYNTEASLLPSLHHRGFFAWGITSVYYIELRRAEQRCLRIAD